MSVLRSRRMGLKELDCGDDDDDDDDDDDYDGGGGGDDDGVNGFVVVCM